FSLLKLVGDYNDRLVKKANTKGILLVRYNDATQRLRKPRLEPDKHEETLQALVRQKETLPRTLQTDVDNTKRHIQDLEDILRTTYGYIEEQAKDLIEHDPNRITIKWNPAIPEHDAFHWNFKEENIRLQ
ncbi:hypothetical protein BGZ65_008970, partial [Modicella reniformis]